MLTDGRWNENYFFFVVASLYRIFTVYFRFLHYIIKCLVYFLFYLFSMYDLKLTLTFILLKNYKFLVSITCIFCINFRSNKIGPFFLCNFDKKINNKIHNLSFRGKLSIGAHGVMPFISLKRH